jgi:hypothetical protein
MQRAEDGVRNQKQFKGHDGGDDKSQNHQPDVDVFNRAGLGIVGLGIVGLGIAGLDIAGLGIGPATGGEEKDVPI